MSREFLKAIFCQESKQVLHEIFFYLQHNCAELPINAPIFWCSIFFESRVCLFTNKVVNKHTLNYRSSPSELTSRIQRLIFLWTPKGFISPEYFLNLFSNLYIPARLPKSFKFMVLRLLENTFENQKIESVHFLSYFRANPHPSPSFLSSPIQTEKNHLFPRNNVFFKIYFPQQKGGRIMHGPEKISECNGHKFR